jgi:hypothetical protein
LRAFRADHNQIYFPRLDHRRIWFAWLDTSGARVGDDARGIMRLLQCKKISITLHHSLDKRRLGKSSPEITLFKQAQSAIAHE